MSILRIFLPFLRILAQIVELYSLLPKGYAADAPYSEYLRLKSFLKFKIYPYLA
jgi:hypothetical protein